MAADDSAVSSIARYRKNSHLDLKPGFISLGLPKSAFGADTSSEAQAPFDAVADAGPSSPDCVWLFRGESFYRFNVKEAKFEEGPRLLSEWAHGWPASFEDGIDAAVWGGPTFPGIWLFFKGDQFIRAEGGKITQGPVQLVPGGWGSMAGTPFTQGIDAALHGVGGKYASMAHLFKGSQYIRHNLLNGSRAVGPMPITEFWALPAPFSEGFDLAFYGSGDREAAIVYIFKDDQCLRFNSTTNRAEGITPIDARFAPMARYLPRPQLFWWRTMRSRAT